MSSIHIFSSLPQLSNFLGNYTLETGAKVIGIVQLITYSVIFICGIAEFHYGLTNRGVNMPSDIVHEAHPIVVLMNLSLVFKGLFSVYLLMGVYKGKPQHVNTWLVVQVAFIILSFLLLIVYLIILILGHLQIIFFIILVLAGFEIYFFVVVYSYYRHLSPSNATSGQYSVPDDVKCIV